MKYCCHVVMLPIKFKLFNFRRNITDMLLYVLPIKFKLFNFRRNIGIRLLNFQFNLNFSIAGEILLLDLRHDDSWLLFMLRSRRQMLAGKGRTQGQLFQLFTIFNIFCLTMK